MSFSDSLSGIDTSLPYKLQWLPVCVVRLLDSLLEFPAERNAKSAKTSHNCAPPPQSSLQKQKLLKAAIAMPVIPTMLVHRVACQMGVPLPV